DIFWVDVAETHKTLDSLRGFISPSHQLVPAILLVGQDHAIGGNCRRDKQSSSFAGAGSEYGIDKVFRFFKTCCRFGEEAEVRRGRIALRMRQTDISVGGLEREILV